MRTLLIEPFGGLAGDMFLAALLDLQAKQAESGFGLEDLRALAESLAPGAFRLEVREVQRGAFRAAHLSVHADEGPSPPHRHLADVLELLERTPLGPSARERATRVFRLLAEAEGRVHGVDAEEVHFHEVGALDAMLDVFGAAWALERIGIDRILSTPPLVGSGTVRCAHGEMPVPAPGTAELLRDMPARLGGEGERLTPTGAALLAGCVDSFELEGDFRSRAVGYGAGTRDPRSGPPNVVRVQIGTTAGLAGGPSGREVWLLAFQVDDSTGEEVAFCSEELRSAGALDVWCTPIQMKKGRPGVLVSALCRPESRTALERAAFDHSSTLGVRWSTVARTECERESIAVELDGHPVRVKRRFRPHARGEVTAADLAPEHEDLAAIARAMGGGGAAGLRALAARAVAAALAAVRERETASGAPPGRAKLP